MTHGYDRIAVQTIGMKTAEAFGMTWRHLAGRGRDRRTAQARFAAIYLAFRYTGAQSDLIARVFARDKASVNYALKSAGILREKVPEFRAKLEELGRQIEMLQTEMPPPIAAGLDDAIDAVFEKLRTRISRAIERNPRAVLDHLTEIAERLDPSADRMETSNGQ